MPGFDWILRVARVCEVTLWFKRKIFQMYHTFKLLMLVNFLSMHLKQ